MSKELVVAALQLPTLGMNATRLEFYLKKAHERGADVMLLGEYVLNTFLKSLLRWLRTWSKPKRKSTLNFLKVWQLSMILFCGTYYCYAKRWVS